MGRIYRTGTGERPFQVTWTLFGRKNKNFIHKIKKKRHYTADLYGKLSQNFIFALFIGDRLCHVSVSAKDPLNDENLATV